MPRCAACPLGPGLRCPSEDRPSWCRNAALERARPDPRQHYWLDRIRELAGDPDPRPRAGPAGTLVIRGYADSSTGYGRLLGHLMRGLEAAGQPTLLDAVAVDESRVPLDPFVAARRLAGPHRGPGLHVDSLPRLEEGSGVFTMWESGRLPPARVEILNRARFIVVPCRWNERVFRESGVLTPIRVVPLGVDQGTYRPSRPPAGPFVVLTVARMAHGGARKGVEELVAAFIEALGRRPDARLHLKLWPDCSLADAGHPRVTIDRAGHDDEGMRRLYTACSAYATMTKGEGWGLPVLEAMACGRPVITPIHSGLADFVTPACSYPVRWDARPGGTDHYTGHGDWAVPRHGSMVARLREAYRDRPGRARRGRAGALRAAEFPWSRSALALLAVLREFGLARPAATDARLAMRAELCEFGSGNCGCGGLPRDCSRPGRPAKVFRPDCLACVSEEPTS